MAPNACPASSSTTSRPSTPRSRCCARTASAPTSSRLLAAMARSAGRKSQRRRHRSRARWGARDAAADVEGQPRLNGLQTWLVVGAGVAALLAVLLGLGFTWWGRRIARAERGAALRAAFTSVGLPARDEVVHLLLDADCGTSTFAFACREPGVGWIDAEVCLPIPEAVVGWQPHPFFPGRRRTVDRDRTANDVAREPARLFREGGPDRVAAIDRDPPRRAEGSPVEKADRCREGGTHKVDVAGFTRIACR